MRQLKDIEIFSRDSTRLASPRKGKSHSLFWWRPSVRANIAYGAVEL